MAWVRVAATSASAFGPMRAATRDRLADRDGTALRSVVGLLRIRVRVAATSASALGSRRAGATADRLCNRATPAQEGVGVLPRAWMRVFGSMRIATATSPRDRYCKAA